MRKVPTKAVGGTPTGGQGALSLLPRLFLFCALLLCARVARGQTTTGAITITGSPLTMTVPSCIASGFAGSAKQNVPYTCALTASNGSGQGYSFSVVSGTPPAGIASVTSTGIFAGTPTGTSAGTQVVKLTDSSGATVQASITITPASLSSIAVTPTSQAVPASGTLQLKATGTWSDGSTSDLTNVATWSCTGTGCSSVSSSGLFTASASAGTPNVKAVFNSVTDDGGSGITVTVTSTTVQIQSSATLCPGQINQSYPEFTAACAPGIGEQLTATGGTPPYTWSLTSGSLNGLSLSSGGLISGTPTGTGTTAPVIKVTDSATNNNSVTFSLAIASLSSLAVTPATPTILVGAQQQFMATGTYSDASTANVTSQVTGGGASLAVAQARACTNSNGSGCTVTISTKAGSLLVLSARQGQNTTSTLSIVSGNSWTQVGGYNTAYGTRESAMFYVCNASAETSVQGTWSGGLGTVVTIIVYEVTGAATSSCLDNSVSNGTTSFVSSLTSGSLTYTNANDILLYQVDVSNAETSATPGTGYAFATNANQMASSNRLSTQYQIVSTTGSGITTSMSWSPNTVNAGGIFAAFKGASSATGWTATDASGGPNVASVNGTGLATGQNPGTSTIEAAIGAVNGSTTLTVSAPNDTSLTITPNPGSGTVGSTVTFTAKGSPSGNDDTASATWSSSNTTVFSFTSGSQGTCNAAGSATVTAQFSGLTGTATVNCTAAGTASVLPGCTVTSGNAINFGSGGCPASLPSPWSLVLAESFESGTLGSSNEYISSGGNDSITASFAHTGTHSLQCSIGFDDAACVLAIHSGVIGSSNHIYVSYWRQMASNACGDTEIYFARVFASNSATFTDIMDTQNNTSPLNTCLTTMSYDWFSAQPQSLSGFGSDPNQYAGPPWPLPIGTWEHVEFEFKGSTCSGSTSNYDGLFNLWINGKLQMGKSNVDLNGCAAGFSSVGMGVEAGGVFTYLNAALQSINPPKGAFNVWEDDVIFLKQ